MTIVELVSDLRKNRYIFRQTWRDGETACARETGDEFTQDRLYVTASDRGELSLVRESTDNVELEQYLPALDDLEATDWEIAKDPSFILSDDPVHEQVEDADDVRDDE